MLAMSENGWQFIRKAAESGHFQSGRHVSTFHTPSMLIGLYIRNRCLPDSHHRNQRLQVRVLPGVLTSSETTCVDSSKVKKCPSQRTQHDGICVPQRESIGYALFSVTSMVRQLINQRFFRSICALAVTIMACAGSADCSTAGRPNFLIIMADDMGYSDIGCYGSEIETPNLDLLAAGGLRFTQFYNTSRCCPTRACLLTGLYPHQAGIGGMMEDAGVDGYRGDLNLNCVTIAEVLSAVGYTTLMSGKYHVTKATKSKGLENKYNWPLQRGFNRFYGTITGAGSYWDPSTLVRDNTMITPATDIEYQSDEPYYYTDAISDNACRFIGEHSGDSPLFMYVAYTCAHWPMHARPRDTAKYRGRYDAGYEMTRAHTIRANEKT